jgi:hypothetical protein
VIALLGEDPRRGIEDPVPDLLLVGCADSRHIDSQNEWFLGAIYRRFVHGATLGG